MFRKNDDYKQYSLFGVEQKLSKKQKKMLESSIEHKFFELIFKKIDECRFSVLYSEKKSRPNVPVNRLVGALILKHLYDWTYYELFKQLTFNVLTRHALGIQHIDEDVFAEASIFNFQNRVTEHYTQTGEDLIREVFDALTTEQLEEFGVCTEIQRGDSFLIGSNIFDYSRLQLLIEVLQRFAKQLEEPDLIKVKELLAPYSGLTSGQFIYHLLREEIPQELDKIASIYHEVYTMFSAKYGDMQIFKIFERVYYEHFSIKDQQVVALASKEMGGGNLESPDDEEATYRKKRNVKSKGYVGHISETAGPDNKLNLITDYTVECNNVDDAKLLENRLEKMKAMTPDIEQYFTDGGYGSPSNDILLEKFKIKQYQTNIRGKKSPGQLRIKTTDTGEYYLTCAGGQRAESELADKRWRAKFDYDICITCPAFEKCGVRTSGVKRVKPNRYYYFDDEKIRVHTRIQNIDTLEPEKRTIRANVEATVKELKRGMRNGKVRVRGKFNTSLYLAFTTIAVNFTRIHKYFDQTCAFFALYCLKCMNGNVKLIPLDKR